MREKLQNKEAEKRITEENKRHTCRGRKYNVKGEK